MTETKTETAAEPEIPEAAPRRPGDLTQRQLLERIVRVDHAGEYGARRIYEGQLAVLKRSPSRPVIQQMWEQEARHLAYFESALPDRRVRLQRGIVRKEVIGQTPRIRAVDLRVHIAAIRIVRLVAPAADQRRRRDVRERPAGGGAQPGRRGQQPGDEERAGGVAD